MVYENDRAVQQAPQEKNQDRPPIFGLSCWTSETGAAKALVFLLVLLFFLLHLILLLFCIASPAYRADAKLTASIPLINAVRHNGYCTAESRDPVQFKKTANYRQSYMFAIPLPDVETKTVERELRHLLLQFGFPHTVASDNGSHFHVINDTATPATTSTGWLCAAIGASKGASITTRRISVS